MRDIVLFAAVLAASTGGLALFAFSQSTHRPWLAPGWVRSRGRVRALRGAGIAALAASLTLAIIRDTASFGVILWIMTLVLAGALVVAALARRRRRANPRVRRI